MKNFFPLVKEYKTQSVLKNNSDKYNNQVNYVQNDSYVQSPGIAFRANFLSGNFIQELRQLKNMSCPYCGIKMLTPEELNVLLEKAVNIKSAKEIVEFLNLNKDCINKNFYPVLDKIIKLGSANQEKKSDEILEILQKDYQIVSDKSIENTQKNIVDILKSNGYSVDENLALEKLANKMKVIPKDCSRKNLYKHICEAIKEAVSKFEPQTQRALYKSLNDEVKQSFINEYLFLDRFYSDDSITKTFLTNLLNYSKADVRKVNYKEDASVNNLMLSCNSCGMAGKNILSLKLEPNNYYNHIYDLANQVLQGNLSSQKDYPIQLQNYIQKLSRGRLIPDNFNPYLHDLLQMSETKVYRSTVFPLTSVSGILCSSCGQKTITHEEKGMLFKQIIDSQNLFDLLDIVKKNKDVIKPRYNIILDNFEKMLFLYPDITEAQMLTKLRSIVNKDVLQKIKENKELTKNILLDYKLSPDEKKGLRKYFSDLDAIKLKIFNHKEEYVLTNDFREAYERFLDSLSDRKELQKNLWDSVYPELARAFSTQLALYPIPEVVKKVGSPLKVMTQNIFTRSLATVDHLDAKIKYLKDKSDIYQKNFVNKKGNLVVMCKDCNNFKGSRILSRWLGGSPDKIQNMKKYLAQIKQLFQDGLIDKEFKYYSYDVKAQVRKLTGIEL